MKIQFYKGVIWGLAVLLVIILGTSKARADSSIIDTDADTFVDVEATSDEDVIHFKTAASERMTITSAGNIGIGTTTPSALMEVNGTLKVDDLRVGDNTIRINQGNNNKIEYSGGTGYITTAAGDALLILPNGGTTTQAQFDANGLTLNTGTSVNEFSTDGTLAGDSDDAVPTEKAVKIYVDAVKPTDLNISGQTAGSFLVFDGTNWVAQGAAKRIKVGTFSRDTTLATGTQAITGVGFKPSVVLFFSYQSSVVGEFSVGVDDGTTARDVADEYNVTANTWTANGSVSINLIQSASSKYDGKVSSLDSDGFTISWVRTNNPSGTANINFIALR